MKLIRIVRCDCEVLDHNDMFFATRRMWGPEQVTSHYIILVPHAHFKQRRYLTTITICYWK